MKKAVKMMCAAMLCGVMFAACGGGSGKGYIGTWEADNGYGTTMSLTFNADGTAVYTGFMDGKLTDGFWEETEVEGNVIIRYGQKGDDGKLATSGTGAGAGVMYKDGIMTQGNITYKKVK